MSTAYTAEIMIDGVKTTEIIRGLVRAKELARTAAQNRGLYLVATDWQRDSGGVWRTRRALSPAIEVSLTPSAAPFIPGQRRDGSEAR